MRYEQLQPVINAHRPQRLLEVGTWNGHRAMIMAAQALKFQERVHYIGFDLFEDATDETDARELNVKQHNTLEDVIGRLNEFKEQNTGFTFEIWAGDTRETLPEWAKAAAAATEKAGKKLSIDLAFIDGGHSVETISSDYGVLSEISNVIVLDDFYISDDNGACPDIEQFGCNKLLADIDHFVMPQADPVAGGGKVQMAIVPREAWPGNHNIVVKTKNCVRDEFIRANIGYSAHVINQWIKQCEPHQMEAVIISGGPSAKEFLPEIRNYLAHKDLAHVFCVKTSHDWLIEEGLIPWGCLLLDPRPHVLDFIDEPHPDIKYLTASMCHPVTTQRLVEHDAHVWGYHAHVGAGEADAIHKALGESIIIGGGSTAAVRGISLLHTLGFRKFTLIGFDSCYSGPDDKVHGIKDKKPIFQVENNGKQFWTDAELLAQTQDFTKLMEGAQDIEVNVLGSGMIAHVFDTMNKKPAKTGFSDLFGE